MNLLGRWGRKRAAAAKAKAEVEAEKARSQEHAYSDSRLPPGPPPTAPPTGPLPERPPFRKGETWPLTMIIESPEPSSFSENQGLPYTGHRGVSPSSSRKSATSDDGRLAHPSPLASAPVESAIHYSSGSPEQHYLGLNMPGHVHSPIPRVRLPKIPSLHSDDGSTPTSSRTYQSSFVNSSFSYLDENLYMMPTPPTSLSSFNSTRTDQSFDSTTHTWSSFPTSPVNHVHPALRPQPLATKLTRSAAPVPNSDSMREAWTSAHSQIYLDKQQIGKSRASEIVNESTTISNRPTTKATNRAYDSHSSAPASIPVELHTRDLRTGSNFSSEGQINPKSSDQLAIEVVRTPFRKKATIPAFEFWHSRAQVSHTSVAQKLKAERQEELRQLDEQILKVTKRLKALENISQRMQTLPSSELLTSKHSVGQKQTVKPNDHIGPRLETINDACSELVSLREKRRTILFDHSSKIVTTENPGLGDGESCKRKSFHGRKNTLDSDFQFPLPGTPLGRDRSSVTIRDETAETGLATTMSCVRQAPSVIEMHVTTPRKSKRSRGNSRSGHRIQPSGYSFITFKSTSSTSLPPFPRSQEGSKRERSIAEKDDDSDWEDEVDGTISGIVHSNVVNKRQASKTPSRPARTNRSRRISSSHKRFYSGSTTHSSLLRVSHSSSFQRPRGHSRRSTQSSLAQAVHLRMRSNSRVIDERIRVSGNAKMMAHDVKQWFVHAPKRMTWHRNEVGRAGNA